MTSKLLNLGLSKYEYIMINIFSFFTIIFITPLLIALQEMVKGNYDLWIPILASIQLSINLTLNLVLLIFKERWEFKK